MKTKYQQTEVGKIPEDWEVTTLGGTATLNYGKSLPEISRSEGGVPVYGSSGVTGCHNQALVQDEGYIIGRKGTIGTVHYSPKPFYPIDTTYYVTKDDINCDFKYFYYLLKYLNLDKLNFDSAVPGLNRDVAYRQKYATPKSISEQQQIASILSSLDDKIELNRKMNKTLEYIGKALFKRWFVDFEFPNDEGVLYKSSGGVMVDSELGEIPEGWNIQPLSAFIEFIKGKKPKKTSEKQEVGYLKQILIETFDTGKFLYAEPQDTTTCTNDDVLMVMDGASSGRVEYGYSGIIGSTLAKISVKEPLCPEFLYFFLKTKERDIRENTTGTSIPHTDKRKIEKYCLSTPSIYMIREFSNIASRLLSKILLNNNEIMNISQVRDSLLPRLMSGKLRVKN